MKVMGFFFISIIALFASWYCLSLAIRETNRAVGSELLAGELRNQFESYKRTQGKGIDSAYICKGRH